MKELTTVLSALICLCNERSNHGKCSIKKGVLRNFAKFTGKHLRWMSGLMSATLLKKRLQHMRSPVNFAKFLRTPFFTEHLRTTASIMKS